MTLPPDVYPFAVNTDYYYYYYYYYYYTTRFPQRTQPIDVYIIHMGYYWLHTSIATIITYDYAIKCYKYQYKHTHTHNLPHQIICTLTEHDSAAT